MEISVLMVNDNKQHKLELTDSASPFEVLNLLGIQPDTVIVTIDDKPIPLDTILEPNSELSVIRVVSGG